MLRKPGPRVRFAHFWPFSCIHCGTRPEHSLQSLRFCIVLRVGAFGLTRLGEDCCRESLRLFGCLDRISLGGSAAIPAKVASNLQPHHKHTFTSRLRDAWGGGFLWRSSAVKRKGHRASHACMLNPGGPSVSVRGLFEHRGNPAPSWTSLYLQPLRDFADERRRHAAAEILAPVGVHDGEEEETSRDVLADGFEALVVEGDGLGQLP